MSISSSAAAEIRLLGGTSSSSRNAVSRLGSSLISNRVSFGLPSSSFLTLSSGNNSRRIGNGILPVEAARDDDARLDDQMQRLVIETGKIIVKKVANMYEESTTHLPEGIADEVARLVEEAANTLLGEGETREKRSGNIEFKRLVKKAAAILWDDVADMHEPLGYTSLDEGVADEVEKLEEAAKEEKSDDDDIEPVNHGMTLSDTYNVGDYIKGKVDMETVVEGVVISKTDEITLLKKAYGETIYALENDDLQGWIEIERKKSV